MDSATASWSTLCMVAFVLGMKHGLDADHLATIDGLTRYNLREHRLLARFCGTLFSLGHGAVVLVVALATAALAQNWEAPHWLEISGAAISVAFLFVLAYLNITALLAAAPGEIVTAVGLKARVLGRFATLRNGWAIAGVGALFALSFDTISQAALFALAASRFGGVAQALLVALLFVAGMLAVDGCNGLWISGLLRRADRTAAIASRIMALTVAGLSVGVGFFTLIRLLFPHVSAWTEGREFWIGATVVFAVSIAFGVGLLAARRRNAASTLATSSTVTINVTA
jgi:high-affinity nickel-transport protein